VSVEIAFELGYYGSNAKDAEIDLYDIAQALTGFQRSLALTTQLVLNDEIITQAPKLKGVEILARPPEVGSWKLPARVVITATALYTIGTAPKDTAIGHLVFSAYDYVIKQSLGFHVDFDKSLGESYENLRNLDNTAPELKEYRYDSLIEKCESSIREIHRPIYGRGTAEKGNISAGSRFDRMSPLGSDLTLSTYEYIHRSIKSNRPEQFKGRVSSYNSNTYYGRIFLHSTGFTIPFQLSGDARLSEKVMIVANSLTANIQRDENEEYGVVYVKAYKVTSKNDRLKKLEIIDISTTPFIIDDDL